MLACLVLEYSEICDLVSCLPSLSVSPFSSAISVSVFTWILSSMIQRRILLACETSNCCVICTLFKVTLLGSEMNVENVYFSGHSTVSQIATITIFCALCPVLSLLLFWTVLQGPHKDLLLCDLLSDGWHEQPLNEVVEALALWVIAEQKGSKILRLIFRCHP